MKLQPLSLLVAAATVLSGCGGAVGEALRPNDHTAAGASARANTCSGSSKYARPLIVDLDQDTRATLEASMKKGVVVVAYDCASFRVLNACKVSSGTYEYAGVSRKEEVIQMKSEDDVHGTLPISAIKVSAEVKSGRSIDLALVRVGMTSTPLTSVARGDLSGQCEGATHYVQSATLGAYSMATGSVGKVGAVAEMFNVGAQSGSERKAMNKDGLLDACQKSDPDASAPPTECRAPLQVELQPILGEIPAAPKVAAAKPNQREERAGAEVENPCPEGFAFAGGICSRATDGPKLCDPKNEAECAKECSKGSGESCRAQGNLMRRSGRRAEAMAPFKKACDLDDADGCAALADLMDPPDVDSPTVADEAREALKYAEKGCRNGSGFACELAGDYLAISYYRLRDKAAGFKAYERGCALKRGTACNEAASLVAKGDGVPKNAVRAVQLLDRACQAGNPMECETLAKALASGKVFDTALEDFKNLDVSAAVYFRACALDWGYCGDSARAVRGFGNVAAALKILQRGCDTGDTGSCFNLGKAYEAGDGVEQDAGKARTFFEKGCNKGAGEQGACAKIGVKPTR